VSVSGLGRFAPDHCGRPQPRDIFIHDLHIDTLKLESRNFRISASVGYKPQQRVGMSETEQLARRHSSISHDPVEELPKDLQELYAQVGIASEIAQVLELEAGNLALAYLAMFVEPEKVTSEETEVFRALIDDVNRKTLGAMFKHIRKMATIDKELLDIMDKALGLHLVRMTLG
jgi:hypothetical protein